MKHLKRFEGYDEKGLLLMMKYKNDISEFCDEYLSYLKDSGYNYTLSVGGDMKQMTISIVKPKIQRHLTDSYKWCEVKDDIIPFYIFLKREFSVINSLVIKNYEADGVDFKVNGLKIEDIDDTTDIDIISIKITIEMI
jgi:hypothetical protein